jgi:hypothetical protein
VNSTMHSLITGLAETERAVAVGSSDVLGVAIVSLAIMLMADKILQKCALNLRIRKIRRENLAHVRELLVEPKNLGVFFGNPLGTLVTNRQRLICLLKRIHIYRPMAYLFQIIQNVLTKKKLRVGSRGIKLI